MSAREECYVLFQSNQRIICQNSFTSWVTFKLKIKLPKAYYFSAKTSEPNLHLNHRIYLSHMQFSHVMYVAQPLMNYIQKSFLTAQYTHSFTNIILTKI